MTVRNQLAAIRKKRRVSASDLAAQAGISRQTVYAIEAGSYIPNTTVALRLARALSSEVEELFRLDEDSGFRPRTCVAELLNPAGPVRPGQPLQLSQVGRRLVAVYSPPLSLGLPPSDGVLLRLPQRGKAKIELLAGAEDFDKRLLIAGCDPGMTVVARFLSKFSGFEVVTAGCSSIQALRWLKEKRVHIAGSHLGSEDGGGSGGKAIRSLFPRGDFRVVTFAGWEEGIAVAHGNRKGIYSVEDFARGDVRIVNREKGAGSRFLLDRSLRKLGIATASVRGYEDIAFGHIPAAWHVCSGKADGCIATRSAARVYGLDFVPLAGEEFDLVIPKRSLEMPQVAALLDALNHSALQRELQSLGGYDTSRTGKILD